LLERQSGRTPIQAALKRWLAQFPIKGDMRVSVDIDPQSFY